MFRSDIPTTCDYNNVVCCFSCTDLSKKVKNTLFAGICMYIYVCA